SDIQSSQLTINKFETLQRLKNEGFTVANQSLYFSNDFKNNAEKVITEIESNYNYPFIAKPVDDGCSSAVKKVKNREELRAFLNLLFRNNIEINVADAAVLKLKPKEEF